MEYKALTQAEQDEMIAEALHAREVEHFQYDLQVRNQESLLQSIPVPNPVEMESVRYLLGLSRDEMILQAKTPEDLVKASAFNEREHLRLNCEAAKLERGRVENYHAALATEIPVDRLAAAMVLVRAKRS